MLGEYLGGWHARRDAPVHINRRPLLWLHLQLARRRRHIGDASPCCRTERRAARRGEARQTIALYAMVKCAARSQLLASPGIPIAHAGRGGPRLCLDRLCMQYRVCAIRCHRKSRPRRNASRGGDAEGVAVSHYLVNGAVGRTDTLSVRCDRQRETVFYRLTQLCNAYTLQAFYKLCPSGSGGVRTSRPCTNRRDGAIRPRSIADPARTT